MQLQRFVTGRARQVPLERASIDNFLPLSQPKPSTKRTKELNPLNGKPARRPDQPKKVKLRDQKFIPVPESAFLGKGKGKARAVDGEGDSGEDSAGEEGEDDDEDEDDLGMLVDGEDDEAMEYIKAGGASFLTGLDAKTISKLVSARYRK
jgi:nucleolar complex protein 3